MIPGCCSDYDHELQVLTMLEMVEESGTADGRTALPLSSRYTFRTSHDLESAGVFLGSSSMALAISRGRRRLKCVL